MKKTLIFERKGKKILIPAKDWDIQKDIKKARALGKEPVTQVPVIKKERYEEIEVYRIKEEAYVRVLYDHETNEYIYESIEPQLTPREEELYKEIKFELIKTMEYNFKEEIRSEKENYIKNMVDELIEKKGLFIDDVVRKRIKYYAIRDFIGFGLIDIIMTDPYIEDISCDGPRIPIFVVHKKYESMKTNTIFESEFELDAFVIGIAQRCGKHISVAEPMIDATLPDGSRLQTTLAKEVTTRGSSFTIRRFREKPMTPSDLIRTKTMSAEMVAYLWHAVEMGESIVVCGGTASGKTTTMNAILLFVPPQMKIITIEDTREINLPHENWIAGLTRSGFGERGKDGKLAGEIDMYELLRAALRQRPQYLVVGEVRGIETYTMFQAMATGHTVYSTMHADSVKSMVYRLENPPINLPRILLTSLNVVIIQGQVKVGKGIARRVKNIVEIVGLEPETNELATNIIYTWNVADDTFSFGGHSFLFERIMGLKNLTRSQMIEEFKRRIEIIEWMGKKDIKDYVEVAKIVSGYYKDPAAIMKIVRKELYER
ncbi:MAG: type II/IV secretion system ATPase subunit [Candidatus Thermoplasmatota archaeon]